MYSRKNILYTNTGNNLFSGEMNFDEDLIGAKRTRRRKGSENKEEVEEEDGAVTAAEEQLKAIPPGCISLLRALRPRVLIKIDLRLRRPATILLLMLFSRNMIRPRDYTEDKFRTRVMRKVFRDVTSLMRGEF